MIEENFDFKQSLLLIIRLRNIWNSLLYQLVSAIIKIVSYSTLNCFNFLLNAQQMARIKLYAVQGWYIVGTNINTFSILLSVRCGCGVCVSSICKVASICKYLNLKFTRLHVCVKWNEKKIFWPINSISLGQKYYINKYNTDERKQCNMTTDYTDTHLSYFVYFYLMSHRRNT